MLPRGLAFLLSALAASAAHAQTTAPVTQPYISVTGEAMAKIAPDQATLTVTAQGEDKKLATAKEIANKKLQAVLSVAKKFGMEGNALKTSYIQVNPRYHYAQDAGQNSGKQVLDGYTASTALELTLADITQLGALIDALTLAGIEHIGGGQMGLKDEQKAREAMLTKAVENAHLRADALAHAAGAKVGKALAISDAGGSIQPPMPMPRMASAMAKSDYAASPELPAGLIEIRQQVSVTYALE